MIDVVGWSSFPGHPESVPGRECDQAGPDPVGGRDVLGGEQPVQHPVPAGFDRRACLVGLSHRLGAAALLTGDAGEREPRGGHIVGGAVAAESLQRQRGELGRLLQPPLGDPDIGQRMGDLGPQQVLTEIAGRLRGLVQGPFGVVEHPEPPVGLADPVQ